MLSLENNKKNILTILIPTYNRKEKLTSTLTKIFSQDLNFVEKVIVIDNHSNYDVFQLFDKFDDTHLEIIKNPINVGMAINIANCFNYCLTKWVWLLSDDDEVDDNAIRKILKSINDSENYGAIKFLDIFTIKEKYQDVIFNHLEDLIDYYYNEGHHGELIFMSNNIYNMDKLHPYLEKCFRFSYTQIPHLILLMSALNDNVPMRVLNEKIITYKHPDVNMHWDQLNIYLGISTLTHVPFKLSKKYYKNLLSLFLDENIMGLYDSVIRNYTDYRFRQYKTIYNTYWKLSLDTYESVKIRIYTIYSLANFLSKNYDKITKIKSLLQRLKMILRSIIYRKKKHSCY